MVNTAKYYFIWVEGLEPKGGEKIKHFNKDGSIEYTTKMSEAMRVRRKELGVVKILMEQAGIANWVLNGNNTFIPIYSAPKGTIWNTESHKKTVLCNKK